MPANTLWDLAEYMLTADARAAVDWQLHALVCWRGERGPQRMAAYEAERSRLVAFDAAHPNVVDDLAAQ